MQTAVVGRAHRAPITPLRALSKDTIPEGPILGVAGGTFPPAFGRLVSAMLALLLRCGALARGTFRGFRTAFTREMASQCEKAALGRWLRRLCKGVTRKGKGKGASAAGVGAKVVTRRCFTDVEQVRHRQGNLQVGHRCGRASTSVNGLGTDRSLT